MVVLETFGKCSVVVPRTSDGSFTLKRPSALEAAGIRNKGPVILIQRRGLFKVSEGDFYARSFRSLIRMLVRSKLITFFLRSSLRTIVTNWREVPVMLAMS